MCDKTKSIPEQETGVGINGFTNTPYIPDGKLELSEAIKALRQRADMLEGLLKNIPESISPEGQAALVYISNLVWRNI